MALPYWPTTRIERSGVSTAWRVSSVATEPGVRSVRTCAGSSGRRRRRRPRRRRARRRLTEHRAPSGDVGAVAGPGHVGVARRRPALGVEHLVTDEREAAVVALLGPPGLLVGLGHVALDAGLRQVAGPAQAGLLVHHRLVDQRRLGPGLDEDEGAGREHHCDHDPDPPPCPVHPGGFDACRRAPCHEATTRGRRRGSRARRPSLRRGRRRRCRPARRRR